MSTLTSYLLLSDLNLNVKVKISALIGQELPSDLEIVSKPGYSPTTMSREAELYVTCQIYADGKPIGVHCSTAYKCFPSEDMRWDEWVTFPIKYRDLAHNSMFVFTVWEITIAQTIKTVNGKEQFQFHGANEAQALGGSCMPVFNKRGLLKLGRRYLKIWPGREGDGALATTTPHRVKGQTARDSMVQVEKMMRQYRQKPLPNWLNKLTQKKIDKMQAGHHQPSHKLCLTIELPPFQFPIVFHEKTCNNMLKDLKPMKDRDRLFILHDPEMRKDSPIERKYHRLAGSSKGLADRDLKPQIAERNRINEIIASPSKTPTQEERRLVWKFRYILTENKNALTKFLRCVDWEDTNDSSHALELLKTWAPIDTADALELLGSAFKNQAVRTHAVQQLHKADNAELNSYLLQLVQGCRYEAEYPSDLTAFLFERACEELELSNFLHWFLAVESQDTTKGEMYRQIHRDYLLMLEEKKPEWREMIRNQTDMIKGLIMISEHASKNTRRVQAKIERMRDCLSPDGECKAMRDFKAVCLPVRPELVLHGIDPDKSTMFRSALAPMLVGFKTEPNGEPKHIHRVIFKCGDDLRQDQLVIQMINLMDSLLKKVNLDLKLTPYRVLAVSPQHGFVEFVQKSHALTAVLEKNDRDIRKFFETHTGGRKQKLHKVLDTFVKSTAGYCVITYLLGIGDRHLDNLLLTEEGHLFHIDFGFIFGKDPKPLPPPMKFCKEMVEAMGGSRSKNYIEFRNHCCLAFNILRKHSKLIINLLSLMADAGIPHLMDDVEKNLLKVQEKFRLDLNDEDAAAYLLTLVDESVSALFPQIMEKMHKWALYWK